MVANPARSAGTITVRGKSNFTTTSSSMNPSDPVLFRQLPVIQKIIQDETWLEGERRGCHVRSDDRVVRDRVCEVILRIGQHLRDTLTGFPQSRVSEVTASVTELSIPNQNEAA